MTASTASQTIGQELGGYSPLMAELADEIFSDDANENKRNKALSEYTACVRRLSMSAILLNVGPVAEIADFAERNISALNHHQDEGSTNGGLKNLLVSWPEKLQHALQNANVGDHSAELVSTLKHRDWLVPLEDSQTKSLLNYFGIEDAEVAESEGTDNGNNKPTIDTSSLEAALMQAPRQPSLEPSLERSESRSEIVEPELELTSNQDDIQSPAEFNGNDVSHDDFKAAEQALLESLRIAQIEDERQASQISEQTDFVTGISPASKQDKLPLDFPDEVSELVIEAFMEEVPQRTAEFSECVQLMVNNEGGMDNVLKAQRIAHTVKGSAAIAGMAPMADMMHLSEDLLEKLVSDGEYPDESLKGLLVDTADSLEELLESLEAQTGLPDSVPLVMQALRNWDQSTPPLPFETATEGSTADETTPVVPRPTQPQTPSPEQAVGALSQPATQTGTQQLPAGGAMEGQLLRSRPTSMDELLRQAGEISISTVQLQGFHDHLNQRLQTLMDQNELVRSRMDELNELVHIRGVPAVRQALAGSQQDDEDFDPLELDQYNEMHSASNALTETLVDANELSKSALQDLSRLNNLLDEQSRAVKDLTDSVMDIRLVPLASIEARLHRTVRQTCRATGKQAKLEIEGSQLQVDNQILTGITDSLLHLLRNAIDHGIEAPQQRVAAGKSATGIIKLRFEQSGDLLQIECEDDGAGFDFVQIRRIAQQQGLITPNQELTEESLVRFTWLPGFSTQEQATEISGRGIGANVIYRQVLEHRGLLDVESHRGQGTTIRIRLPLTLISVHTMLVRTADQIYGVPSTSVEQMLFSDAGVVRPGPESWVFEFEGHEYRVEFLSRLLSLPYPPLDMIQKQTVPLFLVKGDIGDVAVFFDEAIDGRPFVIKKLGEYLPRVHGVAGATVLADGSIATILDIRELLHEDMQIDLPAHVNLPAALSDMGQVPEILVVDDSLSARRAMAQIVGEAGFKVRTAIDGLDAVEEIDRQIPSAILLDLEMPRMTGLEVAMHLRADDATKDIPIIMVTSRSTEKHRQQAESAGVKSFVTKPYVGTELVAEIQKLVSTAAPV